jgi:hypothetical protein
MWAMEEYRDTQPPKPKPMPIAAKSHIINRKSEILFLKTDPKQHTDLSVKRILSIFKLPPLSLF